jgi:serine O-acetyltransferase
MTSIQHDLYRHGGGISTARLWRTFFGHPGFRFLVFKRLCERYGAAHPIGLAARVCYKRLQVKFGYQIPHTCRIGPGLFMGHFGNIVINQGARLGTDCNIAQGVTLGYVSRGERKGCPQVGNRVWIGANAVVVGNVAVGNDVLIAPLTFVNFDVPDNAVVAGNPGKIIHYKGSVGYVNHVPA